MTNRHVISSSLALVLAIIGCGTASDPLPEDLIGVWRNPAPGYEDRFFEVREGWVLFGVGKFDSRMHPIESIHADEVGSTTKLTIEYRAEDGEPVPLELVYVKGNPPHLRIGAREDRWIPEKFASWLQDEES